MSDNMPAELSEKFRKAAVQLMVLMMEADAEMADSEVEAIRAAYQTIGGGRLSREEIEAEAAEIHASGMRRSMFAARIAGLLDYESRELLLQLAARVASADCKLTDEERELLSDLAGSLHLDRDCYARVLATCDGS